MVAAAIAGSGAISGISGLIGSSTSANAQQQAAQAQLQATQAAIAAEQGQFQTGLGYTAPYATLGTASEEELMAEMGILPGETATPGGQQTSSNLPAAAPFTGNTGAPVTANGVPVPGGAVTTGGFNGMGGWLGAVPNISDPSQLPGYQFTLGQGLNATNNVASATGTAAVPGSTNYSGAQQKADIGYAEGLANTYYGSFLQNYWANQNNRYNMLAGLSNQGLGAATSIQGNAVTAGGQIGTTGISGQAAANNLNVGAANTQAAGLSGLGNSLGSSLLLANALGNTGTTIAPTDSQLSAGVQAMFPGVSNP